MIIIIKPINNNSRYTSTVPTTATNKKPFYIQLISTRRCNCCCCCYCIRTSTWLVLVLIMHVIVAEMCVFWYFHFEIHSIAVHMIFFVWPWIVTVRNSFIQIWPLRFIFTVLTNDSKRHSLNECHGIGHTRYLYTQYSLFSTSLAANELIRLSWLSLDVSIAVNFTPAHWQIIVKCSSINIEISLMTSKY